MLGRAFAMGFGLCVGLTDVLSIEVLEGAVYDFKEFERIVKGTVSTSFQVQVRAVEHRDEQGQPWTVGNILAKAGMST